MPEGIIGKGIGGFYYVYYNDLIIECKIRGIFRNKKITPIVGDNVVFEMVSESKGIINQILERKNSISRPSVTNVDQVILVFSIIHPEPNMLFIDKMITFLESKGIEVIICINKIDLDNDENYREIFKIYSNVGYRVLTLSAKKHIGLDKLKVVLDKKISSLAGASGVGKSTILNAILDINVQTGDLSKKIERGKHTTRHVELFKVNGGYILDTPGFSTFELDKIDKDSLKNYFREFINYYNTCRFKGCNHINEPDCRVKQAVLDGNIDSGRYDRYKTIYNELDVIKKYKK